MNAVALRDGTAEAGNGDPRTDGGVGIKTEVGKGDPSVEDSAELRRAVP
jgi:hypothetical protein